jgi:hypothetical protein
MKRVETVTKPRKRPATTKDLEHPQPKPPTPEELQKFWDNISWGYQ